MQRFLATDTDLKADSSGSSDADSTRLGPEECFGLKSFSVLAKPRPFTTWELVQRGQFRLYVTLNQCSSLQATTNKARLEASG